MAVASGFRGLRRVAYCRVALWGAYESVALPLSYPDVRPQTLPLPPRPLRTASRQLQDSVPPRPGNRMCRAYVPTLPACGAASREGMTPHDGGGVRPARRIFA